MDIHLRHGVRGLAVVALVALALTACGKKADAPPPAAVAAVPAAAAPAAAPTAPPAAVVPAAPPAAAVPGAPAAPIIATGEANAPGFRVEINELKRTGNEMVTMKMTFVNDRQESASQFLNTAGLLDLVGKKRYGPVSKGGFEYMCSEQYVTVPAHGRLAAWIRFPEPPPPFRRWGSTSLASSRSTTSSSAEQLCTGVREPRLAWGRAPPAGLTRPRATTNPRPGRAAARRRAAPKPGVKPRTSIEPTVRAAYVSILGELHRKLKG